MTFDLPSILAFLGYPGLALVVFAESGFLLGAILPGDSLLFTAGLIASRGALDIYAITAIAVVFAIAGDSLGYWMGIRYGRRLFSREDSFFFRKEYVGRTEDFYAKHGKKTLVLARFVPMVRTLAPIFAGIGAMSYREFFSYNAIGGILWGAGLTLAGYFLGAAFPQLENYITYVVLGIIALSLAPVAWEYFSASRKRVS